MSRVRGRMRQVVMMRPFPGHEGRLRSNGGNIGYWGPPGRVPNVTGRDNRVVVKNAPTSW